MGKVRTLILRAPGTNCDAETAFAFEQAGAGVSLVHVNRLISGQQKLSDYQIMVIPGGFSYGDDIAAGKILASQVVHNLTDEVQKFVESDKTTIGGGDAGWHLTADGLTPEGTGAEHQAIGIAEDWTDYTLEAKFQYLMFGNWPKEAHLCFRWNDQANKYFIRTIARNNAGAQGPWSIEWLRTFNGANNEGDI